MDLTPRDTVSMECNSLKQNIILKFLISQNWTTCAPGTFIVGEPQNVVIMLSFIF